MSLIKSETTRIFDLYWYKAIREISKQLDPTNIKILTTMAKVGPRNLLEVSRRCGIPFTTVYHRVAQLEAKSKRVAYLIPRVAKVGMVRLVLLTAARAGEEERVAKALKIPNFWRAIEPCEGAFTHHTIQTVPLTFLKQFKEYVTRMAEMSIMKNYRIIPTGDSVPNFPDFSSYNSASKEWTFNWEGWLSELEYAAATRTIVDPEEYVLRADKTDILIIKTLEKNARATFIDIARDIGVSPQTVKYHYDTKLIPSGLVEHFLLDVLPYPMEMAATHEVMLEFTSNDAMNKFFSLIEKLFFVITVSKVLHRNALFVRTNVPHSQVSRMFQFFSQMARNDLIESYSAVRLDYSGRRTQTISYELFDDQKGWVWDFDKSLLELRSLSNEALFPGR